jgi:hypothetical protein
VSNSSDGLSGVLPGEIKRKCGHVSEIYIPVGLTKGRLNEYLNWSRQGVCFECRIANVESHRYRVKRN